jgi:hypothetical protein
VAGVVAVRQHPAQPNGRAALTRVRVGGVNSTASLAHPLFQGLLQDDSRVKKPELGHRNSVQDAFNRALIIKEVDFK